MDFEFFKELCELKTPLEKTEFAENSLKDFCVERDGFGGFIASKGDILSADILLECGIDSGGVTVECIEEEKVKISAFGGAKLSDKINQEIYFSNGASGILRSEKSAEEEEAFYVETIHGEASIGDNGFFKSSFCFTDDTVIGNNISNCVAVSAVIDALKNSSESAAVLFSPQKGFGIISPLLKKYSFKTVISTACCKTSKNITLDGGCAVFVKGKNMIADNALRGSIAETADKSGVKTQLYIGDEDFGLEKLSILYTKGKVGGLLIPVSHLGTTNEIIKLKNAEYMSELLEKIIDGGF